MKPKEWVLSLKEDGDVDHIYLDGTSCISNPVFVVERVAYQKAVEALKAADRLYADDRSRTIVIQTTLRELGEIA